MRTVLRTGGWASNGWTGAMALLFVPVAFAHADTIYLHGGEKLIGKVLVNEKTKVVIQSQALGRLEVSRDRVERIEFDPSPTETPAKASAEPFVPAPPKVPGAPFATTTSTNVPGTNAAKGFRWFRKRRVDEPSTDWIQLKSGEWLRGRLYGMQNRSLEFESDELDDMIFDWKDVHQVISPKALVSYGDRESTWGALHVDRENVMVSGEDDIKFPRYDLVGIAPGSPRELDYWSGRFNLGLNLRAGNTEQADLVTKVKIERRTPLTHLKLEYVGNFSEVNGVETINNQRATESFDYFLTRRLFVRVPFAEYYYDPFQNIGSRVTVGAGIGYYFIDTPKVEWLVSGGPAYQHVRFDSVEAGENSQRSTPAFGLQSNFDIDLTKRTDLELGYQVIMANNNAGGITHHGSITLEIDLTRRIDLDVSFIWDRIGSPQADSTGVVPDQDDYRLNLSLGVKF